jgi:hypothetical protein
MLVIHILLDSFATPINNNVAMLQLEDSNTAYASYVGFTTYFKYIEGGIAFILFLALFYKDLKKLFKKSK